MAARAVAILGLLVVAGWGMQVRRDLDIPATPWAPRSAGVAITAAFAVVLAVGLALLVLIVAALVRRPRRRSPEEELPIQESPGSRWDAVLALASTGAAVGGVALAVWLMASSGSLTTAVWSTLVALLLLVAAAAIRRGAAVRARRDRVPSRPVPNRPTTSMGAAAPFAAAVSAGRAAVRGAGTDPRTSVIACYAAMEEALAGQGTPREPADTPSEYLDRIAASGVGPTAPAARLTQVFREARFSRHPMRPDQQRLAEDALRELDPGSQAPT